MMMSIIVKLVDRQHKNNNDALPIFACFPIGSHIKQTSVTVDA